LIPKPIWIFLGACCFLTRKPLGSCGLRAGVRMMLMMPFRCISNYFTFAQSFRHFCICMYLFIYLFSIRLVLLLLLLLAMTLLFLSIVVYGFSFPRFSSPYKPSSFPCLLFMPQSFLGPWASACWQLCKVFWVLAYDYLNSCSTSLYRPAPYKSNDFH